MSLSSRRILVTGAAGFIGQNLTVRLNELKTISVSTFLRDDDVSKLPELVAKADAVVHLAGENRPPDDSAFRNVNVGLTSKLCDAIRAQHLASGRHVPLIFSSSIQASLDNPYGRSKLAAEQEIYALSKASGNPCIVFRLPGVFGKWSKPYYNSVVATFCHNLARDLPIQINDPTAPLCLVYIDDVIEAFLAALVDPKPGYVTASVKPEYTINLGELAEQIRVLAHSRTSLMTGRVGAGLLRALYATYLSYLPIQKFSCQAIQNTDPRGVFVEMLKTLDCGQLSYFTAFPGVTRGGHYHHTKSEKFMVIKGEAVFRFRHLLTNDFLELHACGSSPTVVHTIPGWVHDITNVGDEELIVMLWANENFDQAKPDTFPMSL